MVPFLPSTREFAEQYYSPRSAKSSTGSKRKLKKISNQFVMTQEVASIYEFGPFLLDPAQRTLLRDGQPLSLTPKTFDMLVFLVQRRGELVAKSDLMNALWPGTFVEESNLTQTVFMLRKALGDTGANQQYIVTVSGRGYRFTPPVRHQAANQISAAVDLDVKPENTPQGTTVVLTQGVRTRPMAFGLVLALAVLVAALAYLHWQETAKAGASARRVMLAVLPFQNLTGDAAEDYFSDGFTEEVITQLGRLDPERLGVIARTSVLGYKQNSVAAGQIGSELRVQYVLVGSVRRSAETVRIAIQLIRTSDSTHLMTREYDREVKDLLQVQAEITQEISDEIQITLGSRRTPNAQPVPIVSYDSYDLYLQGRYYWNKRTQSGFHEAIRLFQEAVEKDPKYARAYAGLADCYAMLSIYGLGPADDYIPKARAAALTSLQIDDSLAEAHASLAIIAQSYDYDWPTAEKEFRRALDLNPNYATAHQWYAESLAFQGRFGEALAESEKARQLDPLSLIVAETMAPSSTSRVNMTGPLSASELS